MTRVLSGAVLIAVAVAIVWFAPPWLFFSAGILIGILAVNELVALARASDLEVSRYSAGIATALVVGSSAAPAGALEIYLMTALVAVAASSLGTWRGGPHALASVSATLFPALYIGLPIAALIGIRALGGARALFLLMLTVIVSDTAQYYSGRAFGRRPLAPVVSPKKTIEGAIGGAVFGTALFALVGTWWLPVVPVAFRALLGLTLVALGIAGDLFESMLKRSAGVKDSSTLIPGHGGILDRIDALLFAAPVYYIVLRYV
jgi:phosphatidate cytidylyltransferase